MENRNQIRIAISATALLILSACVAPQAQVPVGAAPECSGEADCNAKWEAAQLFVVRNADQKIQTATSVLIETYNPTYSTNIAMQVTKEPLGGGRYRLVARAFCNNIFGCNKPVNDVVRLFNATIRDTQP